jgi:MraZ protein
MLTGFFVNTLDEKGRIAFPAKLKSLFTGDTLWVTRGADDCLWAFPPDTWQDFSEKVNGLPLMSKAGRVMTRRFIGASTAVQIDGSGRLAIPQDLRKTAKLSRNCVIIGMGDHCEIWDEETYNAMNGGPGAEEGQDFASIAEQFADLF